MMQITRPDKNLLSVTEIDSDVTGYKNTDAVVSCFMGNIAEMDRHHAHIRSMRGEANPEIKPAVTFGSDLSSISPH